MPSGVSSWRERPFDARRSGHLAKSLLRMGPIEGSAPDIAGRVAIICVVSVFLSVRAVAQEGYYGVGHDRWHMEFYSKLNRNDGKGTCCNLMDCRPTQSRVVGDHYEVKVDGKWTPVPMTRSTMWSRRMVALMSASPARRPK